MDEESDSTNWVLVQETDCVEDLLALKPPVSAVTDSDQESDGSISIISDHPTDSYSEEEHEQPAILEVEKIILPLITIDSDSEASGREEENHVQVPEIACSDNSENPHVEDSSEAPTQDVKISHEANDGDVSSTSESSSIKNWAYVDGTSKVELESSQKLFYLDCSQEPVLEISSNEAEGDSIDTESTPSTNECQKIAKRQEISVSCISNKEPSRDGTFSMIGIGLLISMMVLIGSYLIQQYSEYQNDTVQSPSESFLEGLADNEKARAVIDFCMDRQKSKGEYSEHAVEKCAIKRLRKKNKEEAMKKTQIYLQMKERILTLREKELAEKEKEILRKFRKRSFSGENIEHKSNYNNAKRKESMDGNLKSSKAFDKKEWKKPGHKEKKWRNSEEYDPENEKKDETKNSFHKKYSWNVEEGKEISDYKHKKQETEYSQTNKKKFKMYGKHKEETLEVIKKKVKKLNNLKPNLKDFKGDKHEDPNEEWYIKYNPIKNTIELINITTLPEQDSMLIKNGNKTINGQWYFSLYGSRTNIRNKEKAAEWYFKRGHYRKNKRDKAKWYFDYMSARDNVRYFA